MGIASKVFLKGELISGITLVKELANFDENLKETDWVITGEGRLDSQTMFGKVIQGVLESANKHNICAAVFCGSITVEEDFLIEMGISYLDSVITRAGNLEDAILNGNEYLAKITSEFVEKNF